MERPEINRSAEQGAIASRISREIVRLHADLYGRGPTKAKTHLADEYALCVLEEVFTQAEKTLIRAGNPKQVEATRTAFQDAVEPAFVDVVETATERKVKAFVSGVHTGIDAAFELFLFEESGGQPE
ncbi:MAG TPA: Na-translocating system protein MpsC family protein [Solirubrobacterales bacterium]|nr:Na-translocating system protein MpsC family protein [Solirubrobacterales bacterium]